MKIAQLGVLVEDNVSLTKGMLTHACINMEENVEYVFQPKLLNPNTMKPVGALMISASRIKGGKLVEVDIPTELLGTKVEDTATGYKGSIIGLTYHINGCLHAELKAPGTIKETGSTVESYECDVRRLKGPSIKKLNARELAASIKKNPSPMMKPSPKLMK